VWIKGIQRDYSCGGGGEITTSAGFVDASFYCGRELLGGHGDTLGVVFVVFFVVVFVVVFMVIIVEVFMVVFVVIFGVVFMVVFGDEDDLGLGAFA
jgi:hypothetical protein